jgi:hypothetical protein
MKFECARGAFGTALWLLIALPAFAQSDHQQIPGAGSLASAASCAQSSQSVTRGIDALNARIDEARQTNDAVKMRAAVGDLQVTLAQMKTQLADCTALTEGSAATGRGAMDHPKAQMAPGIPVMRPGSPTPAAGAPTAAPMAGMDHSKMQMPTKSGVASGSGASAAGTKPAAPMAGMSSAKSPAKTTRAEPSKRTAAKPTPMSGMDHSKMTAEEAPPAAGATRSKPAPAPTVLFALRTQPAPPRNGKNDFEVTVKDADGKPITDAEVSLEFSMPAMTSMKAPEVKLTSAGNGSYKGSATLGMAGDWDVAVKASRNGQQLDVKKMRLTAK